MNQETIIQTLAEFLHRKPEEIVLDVPVTSLVTDSFALVELSIHLQETSGVMLGHEDFEGVTTVRHLVHLFESDVEPVLETDCAR